MTLSNAFGGNPRGTVSSEIDAESLSDLNLSYEPLRATLIRKGKALKDLREDVGISGTTLSKIGRNEPISVNILLKIASYLDCKVEDLITFKKEFKFSDSKLAKVLASKELTLDMLLLRCGLEEHIKGIILRGEDLSLKAAKRISSELNVAIEDLF